MRGLSASILKKERGKRVGGGTRKMVRMPDSASANGHLIFAGKCSTLNQWTKAAEGMDPGGLVVVGTTLRYMSP